MEDLRWIGLVPAMFLAVGGLFLWIGIRSRLRVRRFKQRAARAEGLVTEVRTRWAGGSYSTNRTLLHFPVVRFGLPDGREVETEVLSGSNPAPARTGQSVTVCYLPEAPTRARIDGFWADGTLITVGFVLLGGMAAVVGLAGVVAFLALGGLR